MGRPAPRPRSPRARAARILVETHLAHAAAARVDQAAVGTGVTAHVSVLQALVQFAGDS
jgi:hypothetical protein